MRKYGTMLVAVGSVVFIVGVLSPIFGLSINIATFLVADATSLMVLGNATRNM
jgi:hypothetical protein